MVQPVADGFDRFAPEHAAALVTYLSSPGLRFTGRIFGVVGDDITIFDGWSVGHHIDNGENGWTVESLSAALADVPVQHTGFMQGVKGKDAYSSPADFVLEALSVGEQA